MNEAPPPFLNLDYLFNQVLIFLKKLANLGLGDNLAPVLKIILSFLSLFFIIGIIYSLIRVAEIKKAQKEKYAYVEVREEVEMGQNYKKWQSIVEKANSENPSEWKVAILEADAILDDMVNKMGYQGEDLGERLKNIELSDFNTLPQAWEAHKVRNRIAHDIDFPLSDREVRRIVGLYRKVFEEFKYI